MADERTEKGQLETKFPLSPIRNLLLQTGTSDSNSARTEKQKVYNLPIMLQMIPYKI